MAEKIIVTVGAQVRGTNAQTAFGFAAASGECTWTWGLQPAQAVLTWVKATGPTLPLLPLAAMKIEMGGHTFYGVCGEAVAVVSDDGNSLTQRFEDSRTFLQYDLIYGEFNITETRIVSGVLVRRYRHLLPVNFNARRFTYTDMPLTGREILDIVFNAPTVESPWTCDYHTALDAPVYDLDAGSGKKLGTLVAEISERCGTVFTLMGGRYRLVWTVKGIGAVPEFPADSTRRRLGQSVTDAPTRLRVLGERNQYQVLNIELTRDWRPAWENYAWCFDDFVADLYANERTQCIIGNIPAGTRYNGIADDSTHLIGWQLALARAETITVEEYAALRDVRSGVAVGNTFRDARRAAGQARNAMPVRNYLALVWRAFRLPVNFGFQNLQGEFMPLAGMDLLERALVDVTHDPLTGLMGWTWDARMAGNGYAIARGYVSGAFASLRTLSPELFDLEKWVAKQEVWEALPFQLDDSGEDGKFVLFESPVIRSADAFINPLIDEVTQEYVVVKRQPTFTVPPIKVALAFLGERFSLVRGSGTRDEVENVAGLQGQYLVTAGGLVEVPFADGGTAAGKARAIADNLLDRQFILVSGGYTVQGSHATQLTSMIDRVTVRLSAAGLEEDVDFARSRARGVDTRGRVQIEPVRDFERVAQLQPLFPGEKEARERARAAQLTAAALRANPRQARELAALFYELLGFDTPPEAVILRSPEVTPLPAGTPLFTEAAEGPRPWMPAALASAARVTQPRFAGATVRDGDDASGPVRVTKTGQGGVVLLRVKGPVEFRETVGLPADPDDAGAAVAVDYVQTSPHTAVGRCLAAWADATIKLVPVQVAGGGAGGDPVWL